MTACQCAVRPRPLGIERLKLGKQGRSGCERLVLGQETIATRHRHLPLGCITRLHGAHTPYRERDPLFQLQAEQEAVAAE